MADDSFAIGFTGDDASCVQLIPDSELVHKIRGGRTSSSRGSPSSHGRRGSGALHSSRGPGVSRSSSSSGAYTSSSAKHDPFAVAAKAAAKTVVRSVEVKTTKTMSLAAAATDSSVKAAIDSAMRKSGSKKMSDVADADAVMMAVGSTHKLRLQSLMRQIQKAQVVSFCFVVDTTGSMSSHIKAVATQVKDIVKAVQRSKAQVAGVAFVGYKDWCDGVDHFEVLEFTNDLARFEKFVSAITATGGGDCHEDVLGGLERVGKLHWPDSSGSRLLIHFGDAPPHGAEYGSFGDDWSKGHPQDKPVQLLFDRLTQLDVHYYFGEMNSYTDQMKAKFAACLGRDASELCFDAKDPASIAKSVTAAAHSTISVSSDRASKAPASARPAKRRPKMVKSEPNWERLPWIDCTLASYDSPLLFEDIRVGKMKQRASKAKLRVAEAPFDSGSVRLAYYGQIQGRAKLATTTAAASSKSAIDRPASASSSSPSSSPPSPASSSSSPTLSEDTWEQDFVLKEYIDEATYEEGDRYRCMQDMEVQTVAHYFASRFCQELAAKPAKVKFLKVKVARFEQAGIFRYMCAERRIVGGTFTKFTNNLDYVKKDPEHEDLMQLLTAFSHYSYHACKGYLIITDLQGLIHKADGKEGVTLLLTDPAIHCRAPRFGVTNLGADGMEYFFKAHECNKYCEMLKLPCPKDELASLRRE